jgi:hypothetical protein
MNAGEDRAGGASFRRGQPGRGFRRAPARLVAGARRCLLGMAVAVVATGGCGGLSDSQRTAPTGRVQSDRETRCLELRRALLKEYGELMRTTSSGESTPEWRRYVRSGCSGVGIPRRLNPRMCARLQRALETKLLESGVHNVKPQIEQCRPAP